jgi:hypothetical protein
MRSRFKMPEKTFERISDSDSDNSDENSNCIPVQNNLLRQWNKAHTKLLATNRFQLMTRLSQYYQVEQLSRTIDFKLKWQEMNKEYVYGNQKQHEENRHQAEEEEEADPQDTAGQEGGHNDEEEHDNFQEQQQQQQQQQPSDNNLGSSSSSSSSLPRTGGAKPKKTFLASSFHGSPRHLRDLAHNAIAVVTELGPPDLFITGTTNPLWPEIQDRLFPGQTAFDRPDVVAEVFHARLEALIHNIRHGKYFGGRETVYDLRVIEYQHRGLPHFHMVIKLQHMPERQDTEEITSIIDE